MSLHDAILVMALALAVALHAVRVSAANPNPAATQNKTAELTGASLVTELAFENSSTTLTSDARNKLKETLATARQKGKVAEVKILAWADQEYPQPEQGKLDKNQRKLADDRASEIKNFFVDSAPGVAIDSYNMAERSGTFNKLLNTSDARVKQSLEQAGLSDPAKGQLSAKASHALVLFIIK